MHWYLWLDIFQVADEYLTLDVLSTKSDVHTANLRGVKGIPVYGMAQPSRKVRLSKLWASGIGIRTISESESWSPCQNIARHSMCRDSHYTDKTASWLSYFYKGNLTIRYFYIVTAPLLRLRLHISHRPPVVTCTLVIQVTQGHNSWWHIKRAQHVAHNHKFEKMGQFRPSGGTWKD